MSRVLRVLEARGDDEDPNEGQPHPTRETMVVLKGIVMSLADEGDSTDDRYGNRDGSDDSECENDRVVEGMIDEEIVDGVDEPEKAGHCTPRMNATNVLENGGKEDAEWEWGPLYASFGQGSNGAVGRGPYLLKELHEYPEQTS